MRKTAFKNLKGYYLLKQTISLQILPSQRLPSQILLGVILNTRTLFLPSGLRFELCAKTICSEYKTDFWRLILKNLHQIFWILLDHLNWNFQNIFNQFMWKFWTWDHSFSTYAEFFHETKKLTFLAPWYAHGFSVCC